MRQDTLGEDEVEGAGYDNKINTTPGRERQLATTASLMKWKLEQIHHSLCTATGVNVVSDKINLRRWPHCLLMTTYCYKVRYRIRNICETSTDVILFTTHCHSTSHNLRSHPASVNWNGCPPSLSIPLCFCLCLCWPSTYLSSVSLSLPLLFTAYFSQPQTRICLLQILERLRTIRV